MPRYDVHCATCDRTWERACAIADRHAACETCGGPIERLWTTSTPADGFEAFFDIALGRYVTGWGDIRKGMREEHLDFRDKMRPGDLSARRDRIAEQQQEAKRG